MKNSFLALALLASVPAFAQHKVVADKIIGIVGDKVILQSDITNAVADKIVGIVGDKIILKSDITNEILDRQRRNEVLPENAEYPHHAAGARPERHWCMQAEKDSVDRK